MEEKIYFTNTDGLKLCGILTKPQKETQKCVDSFIDVIERFNSQQKAYNKSGRFYKAFCLGFFPKNRIPKEDFLGRTSEYFLKGNNNFFCDRLTYSQQKALKSQKQLF